MSNSQSVESVKSKTQEKALISQSFKNVLIFFLTILVIGFMSATIYLGVKWNNSEAIAEKFRKNLQLERSRS